MATTTRVRLADVALPEIGPAGPEPLLPPTIHAARLERLRARMDERGYDAVVVWGDREHSANLAYLTGFDPRFEEALLVVGADGDPVLLAGNECRGMAEAAPLPLRVLLYQDLSLPGQSRAESLPVPVLLREAGLHAGASVGVAGWKPYANRAVIELPAFVVDELRAVTAPGGAVESASDLFVDAADGLRVTNEVEQLAAFEWAACQTSSGVANVLRHLQPGLSERDCARFLGWSGTPLSCHLMLSAGPRARFGLHSPGDRPIERSDPFTMAYGVWGALTCRAGFVAEDASDLPDGIQDYVERLVAPYFAAVVAWYEALHVGQVGGALQAAVDGHLADPFFGVSLNPGHQLHLDEWVNSPVARGSTVELRSGMALQCDIIPATGTAYFTTNIEDGVALADESLRAAFREGYPEAWERIQARRRFMVDVLGIDLHADVLPFSNLAAHLAPFLLRLDRAMVVA
jgi:Creatinase/Prolidase N-terminal domain